MNFKERFDNEFLPRVEKPSRYLGTELNSVHKDPATAGLRVCLFFPDLYELGLGNLGLHILYAILNQREDVWCERGYSPGPDLEALMRRNRFPMFMYESKEPLGHADLVGFTMQSELTYTNILNAIDLAGLSVRSEQRGDDAPLFFAGGPTAFNPEPLAPFLDFFVIGEGEDAVLEIADAIKPLKDAPKWARLEAVSKIEGCYVPALYPMETLADGQIVPALDGPKIRKRLVQSLDASTYPANYIVPFTNLVHDGIALEVLRGCTQGCRFCQAGMVTRPVRERSIDNIDLLMQRTLANTGFEHVTLVSLSTCDFSRPRTLVKRAAQRAAAENVSVSLPSLRLDSFAVEMADMVTGVRRSGLTFAPEAATPRLRAVINKFIPDDELLTMAAEAYRRGWQHVKTYFMIGLPTERDEDVFAIADLCVRTLNVGKRITPRAGVRTGVSTFVPKPFTPFQWAAQIDLEETARRQGLLAARFRQHPAIKFGRHEPEASFLEGIIGRGDRRVADVIEAAWRRGAKLETWDEHLNIDHWRGALDETGFDWRAALAERPIDARLPWDHIDVLIDKEWFQKDWLAAQELKYAQDCRAGKCHLCGVIYRERALCQTMLKNQKQGHKEEAETWSGVPEKSEEQAPAVQRLRLRVGRTGPARMLSHLEVKDAWVRALRRAGAPIAYSQGFHAQARVTFATAAPVGEESLDDIMDVMLKAELPPQTLFARLSATLPQGFRVHSVLEVPLRGDALMALLEGQHYTLYAEGDAEVLRAKVEALNAGETIEIPRKVKAGKSGKGKQRGRRPLKPTMQMADIKPLIERLEVTGGTARQVEIAFETQAVGGRMAKPREIIDLLGLDPAATRVVKRVTRLRAETAVVTADL